jgi:hypothetical protein
MDLIMNAILAHACLPGQIACHLTTTCNLRKLVMLILALRHNYDDESKARTERGP